MKTGPAIGVALLCCAWAIPLKGQELVVNGGFDDGPFGWMSWQGSALTCLSGLRKQLLPRNRVAPKSDNLQTHSL